MTDEASPLSEILHDLSCGLFKAHLLLLEADRREWRAVHGRLTALKALVAGFPTSPKSSRTLGFRGPVARRAKTK